MLSDSKRDGNLAAIVEAYVQATRHWSRDAYRIEQKEVKATEAVFWVINKEDELLRVPGGGKSFEAHVDLTAKKVTKELHFQ